MQESSPEGDHEVNLTLWDREQTDLTVGERKSARTDIVSTTSGSAFQLKRGFNDSTGSNSLQL